MSDVKKNPTKTNKKKPTIKHLSTSFGVGCFHFGIKKNPPYNYSIERYIKELKKLLKTISSIKNIKITHFGQTNKKKIEKIQKNFPEIDKGDGYFPHIDSLSIEFEVHIPQRIQEEISGRNFEKTENFAISINYNFDFPTTIIEATSPLPNENFSSSVVIVREFLRNEIKKIGSNFIKFECLGPSPIHANFFIKPKKLKKNQKIKIEITKKLSYNKIVIFYNQAEISFKEAKKIVYFKINIQADFFYYLASVRARLIHKWVTISSLVDNYTTKINKKTFSGFWSQLFFPNKEINNITMLLAEFEMDEIHTKDLIRERKDHIFFDEQENILQDSCEEEIKNYYCYPTKQIKELLSLFYNQSSRIFDNFIVITAAIIGGAIGALITLLF